MVGKIFILYLEPKRIKIKKQEDLQKGDIRILG